MDKAPPIGHIRPMRVLITGHHGRIGPWVERALQAAGDATVGYDLIEGCDIRDLEPLCDAARGCDAIVHLAAAQNVADATLMAVNVAGTWNVLQAAKQAGVRRVVHASSVNALGLFFGQGLPDYLPIDDEHPCRPSSSYGMSKRLAEEMCRSFTASSGIATLCLRPPWVTLPDDYEPLRVRWRHEPTSEWLPFWEYGAFLDVRDLAEAVRLALRCEVPGHATMLLCADDIGSPTRDSRAMARRICPGVPWRGGADYDAFPSRALVDSRWARDILGWAPAHRWHAD